MMDDVASESKPKIGTQLGDYNQKFAKSWRKAFEIRGLVDTGKSAKVHKMPLNQIIKELESINR